jgi:hypothetical protein
VPDSSCATSEPSSQRAVMITTLCGIVFATAVLLHEQTIQPGSFQSPRARFVRAGWRAPCPLGIAASSSMRSSTGCLDRCIRLVSPPIRQGKVLYEIARNPIQRRRLGPSRDRAPRPSGRWMSCRRKKTTTWPEGRQTRVPPCNLFVALRRTDHAQQAEGVTVTESRSDGRARVPDRLAM